MQGRATSFSARILTTTPILTLDPKECASLELSAVPTVVRLIAVRAVGVVAMSLHQLQSLITDNLAVVVGVVAALIALGSLVVMSRRRKRFNFADLVAAGTADGQATSQKKALSWEPPEQSYADRRGSARREGAPVRVTLSAPSFRNSTSDGFVVDRSTGGLRIAMQTAMAPGSTMQVRAVNAPDNIGFVTVIVRNCKKSGDFFEIGCEFEKTPPWNVLLLFG